VNAAQAAMIAIERMGTPAVNGRRDVRVPVNGRVRRRFPSVTDLRPTRGDQTHSDLRNSAKGTTMRMAT
jgi:hypothetical protein